MSKFTHIDYDREMAFMAVRPLASGSRTLRNGSTLDFEELGVARVVMDIDLEACEYTILVRSDMKGHGLGHLLTDKMIKYCKARGVKRMNCHALTDNQAMLSFAQSLGFEVHEGKDGLREMHMTLQ
eukprot:3716851-Amphidinium_carterae.1